MKFENRTAEFPAKKILIKVDENNIPIPGEGPIRVNILREEGTVHSQGTPITADNLNKANWRDDQSVSFKMLVNGVLPPAKVAETQMVTKADGKTWIIPPSGLGAAKEISSSGGTDVKVNGNVQSSIEFTSDPQTQITSARNMANTAKDVADSAMGTANGRSAVNVNGVKTDVSFTSDPQTQISNLQTQINSKSAVKVNNVKADVNFTSDPQTQINNAATTNDSRFVRSDQGQSNANRMLVTDDNGKVTASGKIWKTVFSDMVCAGNMINFNFTTGLYRLTYQTHTGTTVFLWESTESPGIDHSPWHTIRRKSAYSQAWFWIIIGLERTASSNNYIVRAGQQNTADAVYVDDRSMGLKRIEKLDSGSSLIMHNVVVSPVSNTSVTFHGVTVSGGQNMIIQVPDGTFINIVWKGTANAGQSGVKLVINGSSAGTTSSATTSSTISTRFTASATITTENMGLGGK